MNKPEWFPFYVRKFASSSNVARMTVEGVGAYILLLCVAWHEEPAGSLPDDDKALAVFARMKPARWSKVRVEVLRAFEKRDDGRWYQPTMVREAEKSYRKMEAASAAGRASANARSTTVQRPLNDRATARVVVGVDVSSGVENTNATTATPTASVERPLNDRCPGTIQLTAPQMAMYTLLIKRPDWLNGQGWVTPERARDLVRLPTTSEPLVREAIKRAKAGRISGVRNPAGLVVDFLKNPDPELAQSLAAQEAQ